ncbi:PREDICTED: zinc finger protein 12-like [Galeopterus variegatus]|uniref:Zinc finger protein 12-like n=1 Tax=Galeopterus variegatus TaxID=482537 RepID=A0ABM0PZ02_GALVR|nr:PREDICTED: zinc finger protein 12-like [Galeopterus variegatus]
MRESPHRRATTGGGNCTKCFSYTPRLQLHHSIHSGEELCKRECVRGVVSRWSSRLQYLHHSIHSGEELCKHECVRSVVFRWS